MFRFAVVVAVALTLCACRQENKEESLPEGAEAPAASATHPASPGGTALVPDVSAGTTVMVSLQDGRIMVNDFDRIPPGPAIFTVTNLGEQTHNLFIEGAGLNKALDQPLTKGGTGSMEAELQTGSYTLYCPLLNHRQNGETVTLVIQPAKAPTTSTVM